MTKEDIKAAIEYFDDDHLEAILAECCWTGPTTEEFKKHFIIMRDAAGLAAG